MRTDDSSYMPHVVLIRSCGSHALANATVGGIRPWASRLRQGVEGQPFVKENPVALHERKLMIQPAPLHLYLVIALHEYMKGAAMFRQFSAKTRVLG